MKNYMIVAVVSALIGAAVVRYYFPKKEISIEVQEKEVIKKDVRTVIKEIIKKDGTKETVTEIVDNSKEQRSSESSIQKDMEKDWFITVGAHTNEFKQPDTLSVSLSRRIIGPIFLGAQVDSNRYLGLSFGLEF